MSTLSIHFYEKSINPISRSNSLNKSFKKGWTLLILFFLNTIAIWPFLILKLLCSNVVEKMEAHNLLILSKITAVAIPTFNDSAFPKAGMVTFCCTNFSNRWPTPCDSEPIRSIPPCGNTI
jgi:hypothetical protein